MNVLFISDLYPLSESDYQTSKVLKNFVDDFIVKGNNVQIIRPNFLLNSFLRGKKFYKTGFYKEAYNVNYISPFLFDVKNKLCDINPYDIIVSHMPSGSIFASKLQGKLICGIHNSDLKILTNTLYSIYFKKELLKAFRRAEKLICRSYTIEASLLSLYPEFRGKTEVVISGIKKEFIIKKEHTVDKKIKILSCANFIARKNLDKLINAVKDFQNVELTIIGDGKDFKKLRKIDSTTIFKGRLPHDEVIKEMKNSDIFILPSIEETFGLVYIEAMASGCITVGTKNEGIDGFIKDGKNGFLTEPTVDGIKKTLEIIFNLDVRQINKITENTYNTALSHTSDICSDKYLEIIKSCL